MKFYFSLVATILFFTSLPVFASPLFSCSNPKHQVEISLGLGASGYTYKAYTLPNLTTPSLVLTHGIITKTQEVKVHSHTGDVYEEIETYYKFINGSYSYQIYSYEGFNYHSRITIKKNNLIIYDEPCF